LTRLSERREHTSAYETLKAHFNEEEQVKLTLTIIIINRWNRLAVGFGVWADPAAIKAAAKAVADR
jgi:alkylhydroperoxidase family enzyme